MSEPTESFACWAIVELLGHVRLVGRVSEEERFGTKMGRIDIPQPGGGSLTQYFSANSIYRLTVTTEAFARKCAAQTGPAPALPWDPSQDDMDQGATVWSESRL